jgi:hypothetical protein
MVRKIDQENKLGKQPSMIFAKDTHLNSFQTTRPHSPPFAIFRKSRYPAVPSESSSQPTNPFSARTDVDLLQVVEQTE